VLSDDEPEVCKTALASLRRISDETIVAAVLALLKKSDSWSVRVHAAKALARQGSGAAGAQRVLAALRHAAVEDGFAMVREAALRSLVSLDRSGATPVLRRIQKHDAEPRLRNLARELARAQGRK
jgi:HEAT repeat protein